MVLFYNRVALIGQILTKFIHSTIKQLQTHKIINSKYKCEKKNHQTHEMTKFEYTIKLWISRFYQYKLS